MEVFEPTAESANVAEVEVLVDVMLQRSRAEAEAREILVANRSEMLMLSRQYESQGERLKATEAVAEQQRLLAASLADAGTKAAAEAKAERRKSSEVEGRAAAAEARAAAAEARADDAQRDLKLQIRGEQDARRAAEEAAAAAARAPPTSCAHLARRTRASSQRRPNASAASSPRCSRASERRSRATRAARRSKRG